ncbi:FMN-binding negative transcriptional regulator [Mycobacteroides salmoniphilum]|uniref:FMN-binding negative transcriptional regulator n=1 Tax=Mycobacteroides salmoniphilum TaxID=404941 RepID=UPI00099471AF|nr:FMN-binding negative transcriptional regulator [Mycobacteroides salmoniphilum]
MYVPKNFVMRDEETAAALAEVGLAHLVTHDDDGYLVTPIPLLHRAATNTLVGHVSRVNPHWQRSGPAVAIFPGPQAYISPSFYATKGESGKVVPTWNYEVITVHGNLTAHDAPDWVRTLVAELTDRREQSRESPWGIDDAPEAFTTAQIRAIVGLRQSPNPADQRVAQCVEVRNSEG